MNWRTFLPRWLVTASLCLFCLLPLEARKTAARSAESQLSPIQAEQLMSLPYGLTDQRSLFIRYRHIESVQFYGGGNSSRSSFRRGASMMPEGLSLRLKNSGPFTWASGKIIFKKPINAALYNSLVLWVRTNHAGLRFWIGMQDPNWKETDRSQARTDVLPFRGFPSGQTIQMVIPFSAIYPEAPIDLTVIRQIAFEFGEDTVGNDKDGVIEVVGIAFVNQTKPVIRPKLVYSRIGQRRELPLSRRSVPSRIKPVEIPAPSQQPEDSQIQTPQPIRNAEPANISEQAPSAVLNMNDAESVASFNKSAEAPLSPAEQLPAIPTGIAQDVTVENAPPPAEQTAAEVPTPAAAPVSEPEPKKTESRDRPLINRWIVPIIGFGILAWFLRRRHKIVSLRRIGKVLLKVNWPFSSPETSGQKYERDFWKGLGSRKVLFAWLSANGHPVDHGGTDFVGETFLKRQVKMADRAGLRLFPSVSFARTAFNYESFLANPRIYYTRPIDAADRPLTDEEIREKEKNAFPVWIPPFWQRKFHLPPRLLVEYGPAQDLPPARENVQFNPTAPELRDVAIQTLERFTRVAPGVRISDAARLVSHAAQVPASNGANGNGNGNGSAARTNGGAPREFWSEVIGAVKSKHPEFIFISDGVGPDPRLIRDVGFDYFENPPLLEALIAQIRAGQVGSVSDKLLGDGGRLLKYSIYDLTRLLRPLPHSETERHQNLLCAMVLSLLPGVIQHDDNLPDDLDRFVQRTARSSVLRKGKFILLSARSGSVLAFARWRRRSLYVAAANFSKDPVETTVQLAPIMEGLDDDKLYLFNNALHGASFLKSLLHQTPSSGPALALWGQSLRDIGLPVKMAGLSLNLFSVSLTHPLSPLAVKDGAVPALAK